MPSLAELTRPYKQADEPDAEAEGDGQPGLDPVGRDLMNALMANFKPKFKDPSEDAPQDGPQDAPKAETPTEE